MKHTKIEFENYLNELQIPEDDKQSNGGCIPNNCKYGTWIRKHDPIAFTVAYNEYIQEHVYNDPVSEYLCSYIK